MPHLLAIFLTPEAWASLVTLAVLEIVLGLDNIVFISVMTGRLEPARQPRARRLGLSFALLTRLGLLFTLSWLMGLDKPLFTLLGKPMSAHSLIMLSGGLFLIGKATFELYDNLEAEPEPKGTKVRRAARSMVLLIIQIMLLDIVFSLDSVITALGMARELLIMALAMVLAVAIMLLFANAVGNFVNRHPTMKVLALAFLLLIGVLLVAEGFGHHVPKGYIYFAMAFAIGVELLNMRLRKRMARRPVELHKRYGKHGAAVRTGVAATAAETSGVEMADD